MTLRRPHTLLFQHTLAWFPLLPQIEIMSFQHIQNRSFTWQETFLHSWGDGGRATGGDHYTQETKQEGEKDKTKGKAFTVMVGEESALMQASAVLEMKGFQHLSVECLQNNLTHPACFCSGVVTVLSSFNGIHFWTEKKEQKNWTKIASLSKMDKICPTQTLFFRKALLYVKSIQRHVRSTVWTSAISV